MLALNEMKLVGYPDLTVSPKDYITVKSIILCHG
jgi:hypothetical protein